MKYEWRKQEKDIYQAKEIPTLVEVPASKYICIKGMEIQIMRILLIELVFLYQVSYTVRMMPKGIHTKRIF